MPEQDFSLLFFVLFMHFFSICCGAYPSCAAVCGTGQLRQFQNAVVVVALEPATVFGRTLGGYFADKAALCQDLDHAEQSQCSAMVFTLGWHSSFCPAQHTG